jgi:hypothetical protein
MKAFSTILLFLCSFFTSFNAQSDVIVNGDFNACTFSGWQTETDGATQHPNSNDNFEIIGATNSCSAKLNIDFELPTATKNTTANSSNRLFQEIHDIASVVSLSFSYSLETENPGTQDIVDTDLFWVAITDGANRYNANGTLGHIISETHIDAIQEENEFELTVSIDGDSFGSHPSNSSIWFLEFGLKVGNKSTSQSDRFGSSLIVDDVFFTQSVVEEVPEPKPFTMFLGSLLILSISKFYGNRK